MFQSARPVGGATDIETEVLSFHNVSIRAPRGGRDYNG